MARRDLNDLPPLDAEHFLCAVVAVLVPLAWFVWATL